MKVRLCRVGRPCAPLRHVALTRAAPPPPLRFATQGRRNHFSSSAKRGRGTAAPQPEGRRRGGGGGARPQPRLSVPLSPCAGTPPPSGSAASPSRLHTQARPGPRRGVFRHCHVVPHQDRPHRARPPGGPGGDGAPGDHDHGRHRRPGGGAVLARPAGLSRPRLGPDRGRADGWHGAALGRAGDDRPRHRRGASARSRRGAAQGPGLRPVDRYRLHRLPGGRRAAVPGPLRPGAGPGAGGVQGPGGVLPGPAGHGPVGGRLVVAGRPRPAGARHGDDVDRQRREPGRGPRARAGNLRPARPRRRGRGLGHHNFTHGSGDRDPCSISPA